MANVVIDDSSLHAIGDALRGKLGESHTERRVVDVIHHPETSKNMKPKIAKTSNAVDFTTRSGGYGNNKNDTQTVKVEGATALLIDVAYQTESTSYDYLLINNGSTKYGGTTLTKKSIVVNGDTATFTFKSDSSNDSYLGYYAEVLGVDADGNVLQEVTPAWDEDIYEDVVVPHVYKPRDMAAAITSIKTGGGGLDIDTDIEDMAVSEIGTDWVNMVRSYLDTVNDNYYGAAIIEAYGQEGDSVFPSGDFAIGGMTTYKLLNLTTLTITDEVAFNGNLKITSTGDYMREISPGVWRMIVSLYNSDNSSTKTIFAGTYNWGQDIRIPYLCTNNATSSASSESMYQILAYNAKFGLDAECYEIRNMHYVYRHNFDLHGNKYFIAKYNPNTYNVQYSSPSLFKIPSYGYNTSDCMNAKYISIDGLCMGGDSSSGKYASFFAKSPQIKRVSFKNCRIYAYFTVAFYLYESYADFSGVEWTHALYDNSTPANPYKFYMAKGEDWKERALYFAEHMPTLTKTVKIDLPEFLDTAWGLENVVQPLINKGYTVTTTLSAYQE